MTTHKLEYAQFVVDKTPYACWEWDIRKRNLDFLKGIDPSYFTYVADANTPHLDDEKAQQAALSIRVAYSQALETLFALLGAMVQAPQCVIGWLLAYRNVELESLVRKLSSGEPVLHRMPIPPSWSSLSLVVHECLPYDEAKKDWIVQGFADAWERFAEEFVDERISAEYNSIKHGLRARPGGFNLKVHIHDVTPQGPLPTRTQDLGGSLYGTSYYMRESLERGRMNFRARHTSRNWNPTNLVNGIYMLAMSIENVLGRLLSLNGEPPGSHLFKSPTTPDAFNAPWKESHGPHHFTQNAILRPDQIGPRSKQEILDSYSRPPAAPAP